MDVICQTWEGLLHPISQSLSRVLNKQGTADFLSILEVFGNRMKHDFECLILLLKPVIFLGGIWRKSSPNFFYSWDHNFQTSFIVAISFVFSSWVWEVPLFWKIFSWGGHRWHWEVRKGKSSKCWGGGGINFT